MYAKRYRFIIIIIYTYNIYDAAAVSRGVKYNKVYINPIETFIVNKTRCVKKRKIIIIIEWTVY